MTKDELKQKLKSAWALHQRIEINRQRLAELRSVAEKCTPTYSLAPAGGGDGDKLTSAVDAIIKAENKLLQSALAYAEAQEDVERLIRSVGDPQLEVVLEKRYLLFEKWEQIALDLSYSWRGIHKLHSKALSALLKKSA